MHMHTHPIYTYTDYIRDLACFSASITLSSVQGFLLDSHMIV